MICFDESDFKSYFPELGEIKAQCSEETLDLLIGESVREVFSVSLKDCGLVEGKEGLRWEFKNMAEIADQLTEKKSQVLKRVSSLANEHHLVDKEGMATKAEYYGGSTTQFIWEELIKEAMDDVAFCLLRETVTFKELLNMGMALRKNIADCLRQDGRHEMETRRDVHEARSAGRGQSFTPLGGRYWDYFQRDEVLRRLKVASLDIENEIDIPIMGDAGGEEVLLTTITLTPPRIIDKLESHGAFNHTHPDLIPKVLDYVDRLFQFWHSGSFTPEEEIGRIAEMHWWLCHAMPYPRGSAACAEILTTAMIEYKSLPFKGFRDDIQVDLEALTTPSIQDYVKAFPGYLKPA